MMIDRYHNVNYINVVDDSKYYIDEKTHYKIQELVGRSTLLIFTLEFDQSLYDNDDAFKIIKGYNHFIKHKYHLDWLKYEHNRIDKLARS